MTELLQANWPFLLVALLIGLAVAWWVFAASRKTSIQRDAAADDAGAVAKRNQALIDTPPVAASVPAAPPEPAAEPAPPPPPPSEVSPAPAPAVTEAPAPQSGDDLTRIKGLGPKLATILAEQGITSFDQIAGWSEADIARVDASLGRFEGRITRDNWVEQARMLSAGDMTAYEAKFGRQ